MPKLSRAPLTAALFFCTTTALAQAAPEGQAGPESSASQAAPAPAPVAPPPSAPPPAAAPAAPAAPAPATQPAPEAAPAPVAPPPPADGAPSPAPAAPPPQAVYAAPPAQLPPPPPGYQYVPVPQAGAPYPAYADLQAELAGVDARLAEIQAHRSRYSVAGPISLMALGFATTIVCAPIAFVFYEFANSTDDDYYYDEYDDDARERRIARGATIGAVAGVGIGITGLALLSAVNRKRNVHKHEYAALKRRKKELLRSLRYGASVTPQHTQLQLGARF